MRKPKAPASKPPASPRPAKSSAAREPLDLAIDPRDKYQAQFYGLAALRRHYERLVFDLKQDGESTSMTELFNAILLHGPSTPEEARDLLRALRDRGR